MDKPKRCEDPEDLCVRARQGWLSAAEREALGRALEESATLRVALEAGRDFDDIAALRAGDDALIAGVADRVLGARVPVRQARGARRRPAALLVAAAAALAASGALGAWWIDTTRTLPSVAPKTSAGNSVNGRKARPIGNLHLEQRHPDVLESAQPVERAAPRTRVEVPRAPAQPSVLPNAPALDAAALFREANAARRAGALDRATALYVQLQREFPQSDEARITHVSLGKLLLARGRALEADRQFSRYLSAGRGALREEALIGRAHSLLRLGRTRDEREVLSTLLRDFPASVYAASAKARLAEL